MNNTPLKIILYIIAGFFFYMVSVLAFIAPSSASVPLVGKVVNMAIFSIPALLALCLGFLAGRNGRKLHETGIVLLSAAAFDAFLVLTIACMWTSPDFRNQLANLKIDVLAMFSDYVTGFGFMALLAILGLLFLRSGKQRPPSLPRQTLQ